MGDAFKLVPELKVRPGTVIELVKLVKEIRSLIRSELPCSCGIVTKCTRCRINLLLDESKVVKEFKL